MVHTLQLTYLWDTDNPRTFPQLLAQATEDGIQYFSGDTQISASDLTISIHTTQTTEYTEKNAYHTYADISYDDKKDHVNPQGRRSISVPVH